MVFAKLLLFLFSVFFVKCELTVDNNSKLEDVYRLDIVAILNHLNSAPVKIYNYKAAVLIDAHKTADITELTLDVQVDCINRYPELPCTDKILVCNAFVRYNPERGSEVLGDVKCKPKIKIVIEDTDEFNLSSSTPDISTENQPLPEIKDSVALSHEAVSSASGEEFVAVKKDSVPCLGCPFDLNTNVDGINELVDSALRHVESERDRKHVAVRVLRIQQQVVAGIKYVLLLEIAPTTCSKLEASNLNSCPLDSEFSPFICEVTFLQRLWINKNKQIISNNCTTTQEFVTPKLLKDHNDLDNEIEINNSPIKPFPDDQKSIIDDTDFDRIAETGVIEDDQLTPSRLSDLESQIIVDKPIDEVATEQVEANQDGNLFSSSSTFSVDNQAVDDKPDTQNTEEVILFEPSQSPSEANEGILAVEEATATDESQSVLEEFVRGLDQPQSDSPGSSSSEESSESTPKSSNNVKIDKNSSENSKENTVAKPSNQTNASNENSSSSSSSEEVKNENKNKNKRRKRSIGQLEKIPAEEKPLVKELADFAARTLDNIDDDNQRRVVLQILGAKKLVNEGIYYHLILRLGVSQCVEDNPNPNEQCREKLLENFTKICKVQVHVSNEFKNPKVVKSQCQNMKKIDHSNRSDHSRYRRDVLVGGNKEISKDDPKIQKFILNSLAHLDSQSNLDNKLKVVKVHSATSQIVAGVLYRIKAEISLSECSKNDPVDIEKCKVVNSGDSKVCNIEVWDKPWLSHSVTTIKCENDEKEYKFETNETKRSRRSLPGGIENQVKDHPEALDHLTKALIHLDSKSSYDTKYKIDDILSVSKQIVAGTLWRIKAKIILSDCNKNKKIDDDDINNKCGVLEGAQSKICDITIHEQPWIEKGTETNITCGIGAAGELHSFRSKREINYHHHPHLLGKDNHDMHYSMFKEFMRKHNKTYSTKREMKYRFKVFSQNMKYARLLNNHEQGTAKYGVTQFADLTRKEFSKGLGLRTDLRNDNDIPFPYAPIPNIPIPVEFDWRNKSAVTEVKNQGQCGSCWAFSVTGNVEGQYAIKYGKLLEFSEQELVDCDKTDQGCGGGLMDNAYRAIEQMGGLETEKDYPYDAEDETCHFHKTLARVELSGAVNISHNETDMAKWLVQNGPISIAINANAMQLYVGGVSHPYKFLCSPNNLDHGVLIVGYGVHTYPLFKKRLPYWIVKNSWGPQWGEQGYYRVYRGDGTCGLNQTPSSAIVA